MMPENPFLPDSQNHRLYRFLGETRAITTRELHMLGFDTARLRDVRKALRPHLISIECHTIPGVKGDRVYRVTGI
jgi:hypothetical protein